MKVLLLIAVFFSIGKVQAQVPPKIETGNNKFAFDLFKNITSTDKNTFFSPYSISTAMAMTYAGAQKVTATEMAEVMHFFSDKEYTNSEFKRLINTINSRNGEDVKLNVANRLFGDEKFKFNEEYLKTVLENFEAPIEKLNFSDKEKSRKTINTWVEEKTNHKIKDLIKKDVLPDSTKLVLVNAIYFYGDWAKQFDSTQTILKKFFVNSEKSIDHKMMFQKSNFEYLENESYQAIRMPYKGNKLYMEVYLPIKKAGIDELEKKFTYDEWSKNEHNFKYEEVLVNFPKFKMTCDFTLGSKLQSMGMPNAFSDAADFFAMVQKKEDGLKISEVIHKAFIDVGEKGTEAAAATAVIMIKTTSSIHIERELPKVFNADHPFLFIIKDRETRSILFMGKVMNPSI